jgi:hypothetical protein
MASRTLGNASYSLRDPCGARLGPRRFSPGRIFFGKTLNEIDAKGAARGPPSDGEPFSGWAAGLSPHGLALCDSPSRLSATYAARGGRARGRMPPTPHPPKKSAFACQGFDERQLRWVGERGFRPRSERRGAAEPGARPPRTQKNDAKGAARGALCAGANTVADGAAGLSPQWPRSLRLDLRVGGELTQPPPRPARAVASGFPQRARKSGVCAASGTRRRPPGRRPRLCGR